MKRLLVLTFMMTFLSTPRVGAQAKAGATINSLAFLSGRWVRESPDGTEEEYWSKPMGSSMVGTYRVVKDGKAVFYEFWAIEMDGDQLVFKMKHFNEGLVGWEEKADMVRLTTSIGGMQDVLFSNPDGSLRLRYRLVGDELTSTLQRTKDGKIKEDVFHLRRSR